MKIRRIVIRNFRSLKDVTLDDLGDLNVLIGANSSGKSNILEALMLFFSQFDAAPSRNLGAVSDYIWFDRNPDSPIELNFRLEVSREELGKIIPEQLMSIVKASEVNHVEISRSISGTAQSASWITKELVINDKAVIKDGNLVLPPEELLVQPPIQATALHGMVLQNLSQILQKAFHMVYAARNYIGSWARLGDRAAIIQPNIISELTQVGQSLERRQVSRWGRIEDSSRRVSPTIEDLRVVAGQVTVREAWSEERFPIALVGGGHQETLALMHQLLGTDALIFGIEEPEIHLHPQLARRLFNVLKQMSKEKQIFIATHSTIFVDHAELTNTWIVRREGRETRVERIRESKELKHLFYELGVKPSDIFFSNGLVFVEGESDKAVIPVLAEKLGIDFKEHELTVIPTHGKSSGRYHLQLWTDAAKSTQIPFFMILDKDAEKETKKLADILTPGDNLFLLRKGSIEEYYPDQHLLAALKETYEIEIPDDDQKKILASPRDSNIEVYLKTKKIDTKGWKVRIGQAVAQRMTPDDIDDELKRILERIRTKLSLG
jgi:predicted ATPase